MIGLLTTIWPMITAACAMLAMTQAFLWWHSQREWVYPLSLTMALGAMAVSLLEMRLVTSPDVAQHENLLFWLNIAIALVLVPMVWSIQVYLPRARRWLAILISALWAVGILVNVMLPGNLTFSENMEVTRHLTRWGDEFFIARGEINEWKWLADITIILIPFYAIDAAWQGRKLTGAGKGWTIATGVVLFVAIAGVQSVLIDHGVYQAPILISLAFLFVVVAMTWALARDAIRVRTMDSKVVEAQRETERLMRFNLMGEVAAALAHELNQPLAAILSNAQAGQKYLDRSKPNLAEIREILADIVQDDKRARDIITNLRNMLRGEQAENQGVRLEDAARWALMFMANQLERNEIQAKFTARGDIPQVGGGQVAIQQVILNLLINAERAIRDSNTERREIQLSLLESEGGAEIAVRDFGPGLAENSRERIFEPFITTKKGSLGMGLVVCRRIVENQGGRISAESPKDGGTLFRVWLPECCM